MLGRRILFLAGLALSALHAFGAGSGSLLSITHAGATTNVTFEDFATLPRAEVKLAEMHGKREKLYSGVAMRDILLKAGAPLGEKLQGPALAMGVMVHCKDGYRVLFSLAEFDEAFSSRMILLADREDGAILPPSAAPLRIIAAGDQRGARSARQVVAIEIVSLIPKS